MIGLARKKRVSHWNCFSNRSFSGNFLKKAERKFMSQQIIKQTAIFIFVILTIFNFGSQAAQAQICQPVTNGLVSWYRAESDAADAQNSNHGALRNGTAFAPGRVGRAFKFDGADDFVEIPDASSLKPQNLTLEAWVKFDNLTSTVSGSAPPGFQYIVFKKNANQILFEGYALIKLPDNRLAYTSISNSGVHTTIVDNTQTVEVGKYYHVVGSYDGTTARLFVNGRKVAEQVHGQPLDYDTRPVTIGGTNEANWDGKMNGAIDEVKIYNRALSDAEIQANYLADNCRAAANVPANLAAWHAGDGDARDFTGAGDGTIFFGNTKFIVGKVGQALAFDVNGSSGGGVQLPNSVFRGQTEGTIETWVRLRGLPLGQFGASAIWAEVEEPRTSTRFGIYYLADGKIGAFSDFSTINAISMSVVPQNEWLHVAAVYKSGETVKLYLNGALAAESPNTGGALSDTPAGFVGIGAYHSGFNDDFSLHGDVDEASTYRRALAASEIQAIYNAGTAGKIRKVATNAGANVVNLLRDATITFASVTTAGETAQTPLEASALPALPQGFGQTGLAYDISTNADVSGGSIDLCFNLPALTGERFSRLRVLHLENGAWVNRTTAVNSPRLCARVPSLSPFVIAENFAPTAASVTVGGRVTSGKRGIAGARISLTAASGETRAAITNQFGYYRFADVPAGATYILAVRNKQYIFANPTRVLNVSEEITDADFIAQPTIFERFR